MTPVRRPPSAPKKTGRSSRRFAGAQPGGAPVKPAPSVTPAQAAAAKAYRDAFRRGIKPEPRLSLSEWMEREFVLSTETSAVAGRIRLHPFQVELADAITDPEVERVTFMKSARVGYTTIIKAAIGYHIDQAPCPTMVVQPTIQDAEGFSTEEIAPMIRDTPALAGKVADPRARDSGNTILKKNYPGGYLAIVGANSPTGFRRRAIRLLLMDELDGYPPSAGTEGDQEKLAERRTETFWNRKIVKGSTPTVKDASRIEKAFNLGDRRLYYVPCPKCRHMQPITWAAIKWESGKPDTARFECGKCKAKVPHERKRWMLERGEWRATEKNPKEPRHASYRIWAGYSLNANSTWADIVREFLKAKKDREELKTFVNTVLGETWDFQDGEAIASEGLFARREDYGFDPLPEGVVVITCAVDVQDDRLEVELKGWGLGFESWSLEHHVLIGSPGLPDVWQQLDEVREQLYRLPNGVELEVSATTVDTGGHHADAVYQYVKARASRRVFAVKGSSRTGTPIVGRPTKPTKKSRGVILVPVGTEAAKDWIFAKLKLEKAGPGFAHFPKTYDEEYFAQLTSERAILKFRSGVPYRAYKQVRARNEALDLFVYNLAALRLLNPNLEKVAESLGRKAAATPPKPKPAPAQAGAEAEAEKPAPKLVRKARRPKRGGWSTKW